MKQFIGTKLINAKAMTHLDYNKFRGWELPEDENGNDEGFLVEYINSPTKNTEEYDNYVSWSPTKEFEDAYRETSGMPFGLAIEAMKKGYKVARTGWNGKGMFCLLIPGSKGITFTEGTPYAEALGSDTDCNEILPHIDMYTTNAEGRRAMLPGWLASQTDMLADDWEIIK